MRQLTIPTDKEASILAAIFYGAHDFDLKPNIQSRIIDKFVVVAGYVVAYRIAKETTEYVGIRNREYAAMSYRTWY